MANRYSTEYLTKVATAGHDIYVLTFEEATSDLVKEIAEENGITRTDAKNALLNALIYNCVREEIKGQVAFLLGND